MPVDVKKLFEYWTSDAGYAWDVAETLFASKKYPEALFFAHLALEKLLKGLVVAETREHAPKIHDLVTLAKKADLALSQQQIDALNEYTTFNMAGRYEEAKMEFRQKCTHKFTERNFTRMKQFYLWLERETKKVSQNQ